MQYNALFLGVPLGVKYPKGLVEFINKHVPQLIIVFSNYVIDLPFDDLGLDIKPIVLYINDYLIGDTHHMFKLSDLRVLAIGESELDFETTENGVYLNALSTYGAFDVLVYSSSVSNVHVSDDNRTIISLGPSSLGLMNPLNREDSKDDVPSWLYLASKEDGKLNVVLCQDVDNEIIFKKAVIATNTGSRNEEQT